MNILLITKNLPYPLDQGGNIRNYYLMKYLSRYHRLFLVSIVRSRKEAGYVEQVKPFCERVEGVLLERTASLKLRDVVRSCLSPLPYTVLANSDDRVRVAIDQVIKDCQIDIIQLQELYVAANIDIAECEQPVVLDAFNRESAILRRMAAVSANPVKRLFYRIQMRKMDEFERKIVGRAMAVFAVSALEQRYFSCLNCRVFCVPNGVDEIRARVQPEEPRLLFTGLLRYPPNRDGVTFLVRNIWPLVCRAFPGAVLEIVGRDPGRGLLRYRSPQIQFYSGVDDLTPFLERARVLVVPLRAAGGTRLKILQAFGAGIPVVSTSIGAEGLDVEDDRHLLLRDDAASFADAVVRVLRGGGVAERLAENAARLVERRYLWKNIVQACASAYASTTGG